MAKQKLGAGHAAAMLRLGLREIRNAINPSKESVADTEIGLYGSKTQGEIAEARGGPSKGADQESRAKLSLAALRAKAQERSQSAKGNQGKQQGNDQGKRRGRGAEM